MGVAPKTAGRQHSISQFKSNLKVVLEKISHSQINNHV